MLRLFKRFFLFLVGALCGLSVAIFIFLNRSKLSIDLLFFETIEIPVWFLVGISMIIGATIPTLLSIASGFESFQEKRQFQKQIQKLQKEIASLRNLPLRDLPDKRIAKPQTTESALFVAREQVRERVLIKTDLDLLAVEDMDEDELYPVVIEERD